MIRRDPTELTTRTFDLSIVGGGVYGICLAYEAARRGLEPLLVERDDFGAATSWNSLRILHGGLRYLQTLDLTRFRESVRERREWMRAFPDLVRPLPCLMPLYGDGLKRPSIFRVALTLNDLLSATRNVGVRRDLHLGRGRVLRRSEVVRAAPGVRESGLEGGALWWDAAAPDTQRILIELLHRANAAGATTVNDASAEGVVVDARGRVEGLEVTDRRTGDSHVARCRHVVNCSGPWGPDWARAVDRDVPDLFHRSYAVNLAFDIDAPCAWALAVAPASPGSRVYFLHPWKGRVFAGTYHAPWAPGDPVDALPESVVEAMIADLDAAYPALGFSRDRVFRVTWGFLPAAQAGAIDLAVRPVIAHHADHGGIEGVHSVSGVKFTTARYVAREVLDRVVGPVRSGTVAAEDTTLHATWPSAREMLDRIERDPEGARSVVDRIAAEESASTPDDVLLRRTDWGDDPETAGRLSAFVASAMRTPERASGQAAP